MMRNALRSLQGHLGKDLRKTVIPLPPSMTIPISQVIKPSLDNFSIVGRESCNLSRRIKEAIYIRVNYPSLNRNIGKE